jgi:hypothetical protein
VGPDGRVRFQGLTPRAGGRRIARNRPANRFGFPKRLYSAGPWAVASISGGDAEGTQEQALAFHGTHGLGFTWTHNILHVVLALAAFVFGFANLPGRLTKAFAIIFGVVYAGLGVLGFLLTNVVHILIGAWALTAGHAARYD